MEFLTDYQKKMNEYKVKYEESQREIEELQSTSSLLASDYQNAVGDMEFDKANKLLKQLRDIEDEIQVKKEIAAVIKSKSLQCDPKDAKQIEKNFNKYLDKKRKEAAAIQKEFEKKRSEYIAVVKELKAHNENVRQAVNVIVNLPYNFPEELWRPAYNLDITLKSQLVINQSDFR